MTSNSENNFRNWLKKYFPDNLYIRKVADFKQIGTGANRGLPDFLVISSGETFWFEVKLTKSKKTFNLNDIRESQWIEFRKMSDAGASLFLGIYFNTGLVTVAFDYLWNIKFKEGRSSVSYEECSNAEAFCE